MKWVTRERPKIDRIACPWLIARHIDASPEFLFVAPTDVLRVARADRTRCAQVVLVTVASRTTSKVVALDDAGKPSTLGRAADFDVLARFGNFPVQLSANLPAVTGALELFG